jgi:hypothetical protein
VIQITNNKFNNNNRAIEILGFTPDALPYFAHNDISDNEINPNYDTNTPEATFSGITIERTSPTGYDNMRIFANTIRATSGIDLNLINNVVIFDNNIEIIAPIQVNNYYNNPQKQYGIKSTYGLSNTIVSNKIYTKLWIPSHPNSGYLYGIRTDGPELNIKDNKISNLNAGIYITGNHLMGSHFSCNYLENNYNGFYFNNNALISNQVSPSMPSGNKWVNNRSYKMGGAMALNAAPKNWYFSSLGAFETINQLQIEYGLQQYIFLQPTPIQSNCPSLRPATAPKEAEVERNQIFGATINDTLHLNDSPTTEVNLQLCHDYTYRALMSNDTLLRLGVPSDDEYATYLKKNER